MQIENKNPFPNIIYKATKFTSTYVYQENPITP